MNRRTWSTSAGRACAGVAGVVLAHAVDYAAVFPDPSRRARVLAETGHDYWSLAVTTAMVAAVLAVAGAVCRGVGAAQDQRMRRTVPAPARARRRFVELARFQVGLFGVLEVSERLRAGTSPAVLLYERAFLCGIVLQVLVAALATVVLAGLEQLSRQAAERVTALAPRLAAASSVLCLHPSVWASETIPRDVRLRGPPA